MRRIPWLWNASILLSGRYWEETVVAGGVHHVALRRTGSAVLRIGPAPHRLEVRCGIAWSLFLTGPKLRSWGFHTRERWVHWREYTDPADPGAYR